MRTKAKNLKKNLTLPNLDISVEEEEQLKKEYINIFKKTHPNLPTITKSNYRELRQNSLNADSKAKETLKQGSLKLAFKVLLNLYLTKDVGDYSFEDSLSDVYVLNNNIFEYSLKQSTSFIEYQFFYETLMYRYLNRHLLNYVFRNLDLAKSLFENRKLVGDVDSFVIENINDKLLEDEARELIKEMLETLEPREQTIVAKYYGLNDGVPKSSPKIGQDYNLVTASISRYLVRAHRKIRHPSRKKYLSVYKDGI